MSNINLARIQSNGGYGIDTQTIRIQISRKYRPEDNRWEHEKIEQLPNLDVRHKYTPEISKWADTYWQQPNQRGVIAQSGSRVETLTNQEAYEFMLKKYIDAAISQVNDKWQQQYQKDFDKFIAEQKETA